MKHSKTIEYLPGIAQNGIKYTCKSIFDTRILFSSRYAIFCNLRRRQWWLVSVVKRPQSLARGQTAQTDGGLWTELPTP